jgi:hypothetical protein
MRFQDSVFSAAAAAAAASFQQESAMLASRNSGSLASFIRTSNKSIRKLITIQISSPAGRPSVAPSGSSSEEYRLLPARAIFSNENGFDPMHGGLQHDRRLSDTPPRRISGPGAAE